MWGAKIMRRPPAPVQSAACDNCKPMSAAYILTLSCPDRPGIVHAVSGFLLERGGNIEEAAPYNEHDTGLVFMRVGSACGQLTQEALRVQLGMFAGGFQMEWQLHDCTQPMK